MGRQRYTPEQIIGTWREVEVALAKGHTVVEVCRSLGITEQTAYRWRNEYGGLKVEQAKRLKDLERENARLRRAVWEWYNNWGQVMIGDQPAAARALSIRSFLVVFSSTTFSTDNLALAQTHYARILNRILDTF